MLDPVCFISLSLCLFYHILASSLSTCKLSMLDQKKKNNELPIYIYIYINGHIFIYMPIYFIDCMYLYLIWSPGECGVCDSAVVPIGL